MSEVNWLEVALNSSNDLKVIMKGTVEKKSEEKIGVVSLIYASADVEKIKQVYAKVTADDPESYYMVYGVDLDQRLDSLPHYPSIAIEKSDLA